VVGAKSDIDGTTYYLYSTDSGKLEVLGKQYPRLDVSKLGRTRIVEFPVQDGTIVSGLLTEPPGSDAAHRPLIVMVRNVDEEPAVGSYDSLVQFLSSRGYAVLRVNSRGLLGYGRAWIKVARYDWSGLPYTDSLDGARWATASGLADPKRVCIMGRWWGGYTALLGAVRNSDVFKCAAAIDSTGDLSLEPSWLQNSESTDPHSQAQIGLDTRTLRKDAPRWNADRVNIPILLVHYTIRGNEDEDMRAMAKALRSAKKPHTEVEIKIANPRSKTAKERAQLLESLERFFAAHLGS
jgi:dipeptidyl aminopeptidase/acylaminoacyl peptidase